MVKGCTGKKKLISEIAKKAGTSRETAEKVLEIFWQTVREQTAQGNTVRYIPYGSFQPRLHKGRQLKNPLTKEIVPVRDKTVISFKTGSALKLKT